MMPDPVVVWVHPDMPEVFPMQMPDGRQLWVRKPDHSVRVEQGPGEWLELRTVAHEVHGAAYGDGSADLVLG